MKSLELTPEQKEELEKFGANTWFVEYLHKQYLNNPDALPEQWQRFFSKVSRQDKPNNQKSKNNGISNLPEFKSVNLPEPGEEDETQIIAGSAERILDNMIASLTIPVATSQRTMPVKLLEENRKIINQYLKKKNRGRVSFTHLISWAILRAVKVIGVMNNALTNLNGKPTIIKRKNVNLGLAIDIEKKDGSHSLLVPNIKNANRMNFKEFWDAYEDLVKRSRSGQIDPAEFMGTTITLTNPGTIGTVASVPRLMTGQGSIIATGAIQYPAEYQAMSKSTISTLGVSKVMMLTSTYDHRIIQGAESGLFLKEVHEYLLGKDNFFEEIFDALKIPMKPYKWQTDYQPGIFEGAANTEEIEKQARVLQLINLYRVRGHLIAELDPLGFQIPYHPELDPATFKLTVWDLDRKFITGGFSGLKTATLRQILEILQKTYCEKIGVEYMHIQNPAEKIWLQNKMEPIQNSPNFELEIKKTILNKLIIAESFEHFIHNRFIGHKRFSLEGSETLIPVLDMILNEASEEGIQEVVLGMAHRGRLNVLANIIGKPYDSIFSEFEDILDPNSIEGSGDVKYHLGATGRYTTRNGKSIAVSVASNPSHLEWVNPVVEGVVRAKQTRLNDSRTHKKVMSLLIHGDAAFAGQGIVAETLNLSQLKGYRTGGTVHIIINNQIGFTTTPEDARSSVYATDVAKMIQAPIFHVNGDDPEAALWVSKIAFDYRQIFKKDVVIDLFGYRRHGHNEGDEPGFTQPLLYEKIKNHPSVRKIYSQRLLKEEELSEDEINKMNNGVNDVLSQSFEKVKRKNISFETEPPLAVSKEKIQSIEPNENTGISEDKIKNVVEGLTTVPEGFSIHPKLKKSMTKRRELIQYEKTDIDWSFAESLAFGSLLLEGTPVRLSGQDSVRGTFSQRHLALTDINTGEEYFPLNFISKEQAKLEALDSLLSEAAVLGFEYGYSTADPLALVMWEAQFGDFSNGGQIIIDNFIVASYEKWHLPNNIVLLLPHGYEGQGPEHSSARLERFLILCAQDNMQVCYPSTPAQYFHLLRRQIRNVVRKPLVVMTPKSLLRNPDAKSSKEELIHGRFNEFIDHNIVQYKDSVNKILLTSGKVYYDLVKFREKNNIKNTAIIRIEQYYPFKQEKAKEILSSYLKAEKIVWVQEEPRNMGAWTFLNSRITELLKEGQKLLYSGRPEAASPAVGSASISNQQQKELVENAFKF
jgi:multifunctional 2-oxoglutarate metabolism enzyme